MSFVGDTEELDREGSGEVGFKRHLLLPGLVVTAAEVLLVVLPLWTMFELGDIETSVLVRIAVPVLAGASVVWIAALAAWLVPIQRAIQHRRRGIKLRTELAERAYRATWRVPLRVLLVRTAMWAASAVTIGAFLVKYELWAPRELAEFTSLTALHAFAVNVARAIWLAIVLSLVRARLFAKMSPLLRFRDGYFSRLVLVSLVVSAGTLAASAAFLYYFLPISLDQYLQIETFLPAALAVGLAGWVVVARRASRPIERYLERYFERSQGDTRGSLASGAATARAVYRRVQSLPYRLALANLVVWAVVVIAAGWVAHVRLRFDLDDTFLMAGIALLVALGAAIYQSLWHRDTMRALLSHLTVRHRLRLGDMRPSVSLRSKLLLSFGGVVMLACGLALIWSFILYKTLRTEHVSREATVNLAWLRAEFKAAARELDEPPTSAWARTILQTIHARSPESTAVVYYQPRAHGEAMTAIGGGLDGAPQLPWYARAKMMLPRDDEMTLGSIELTGRHGRLSVVWGDAAYELGALAVMFPSYRGRGPSIVRPLKELLAFFLALFAACAGIVLITVGQFVVPIRKLEQRANGMAQGKLAEPVSAGGEGDEIGRLTFALEEMRRALREKLRSTEEVNLDLEREVSRRTADLAKKNRELAETLDKLTRTQDQLVRSEKMASIGQLVAGIAHEINNPVNAIVNTVGPLEEVIGLIDSDDDAERDEAASDVRDMVRVINRGAQRTKDIVRALHNYSRTDDEHVVEFDLNRGLDDSLELLRHVLKQNIAVERAFGDVGRIRGHAGQLNQVFMNLLTNAAQALAGRDGGAIRVETSGEGDDVVIAISDNGPGIPAEVLPRIFDPFFTTKDVGEGTGLGLSIVHRLVERHGGTIEVDSEPGAGTTFTVTLPRSPDAALPAERPRETAS